jgi:acetyl/propionyl-CoA carboxylase alpha subunit
VCAEDPDKRFMPSPGSVTAYAVPEGVRVDSAIALGSVVPPNYDSLLAKVIVAGRDRPDAIARLAGALDATTIGGIKTNLSLFPKVLDAAAFKAGSHDTSLLLELGYKF